MRAGRSGVHFGKIGEAIMPLNRQTADQSLFRRSALPA
jgi:hypothetical protein